MEVREWHALETFHHNNFRTDLDVFANAHRDLQNAGLVGLQRREHNDCIHDHNHINFVDKYEYVSHAWMVRLQGPNIGNYYHYHLFKRVGYDDLYKQGLVWTMSRRRPGYNYTSDCRPPAMAARIYTSADLSCSVDTLKAFLEEDPLSIVHGDHNLTRDVHTAGVSAMMMPSAQPFANLPIIS